MKIRSSLYGLIGLALVMHSATTGTAVAAATVRITKLQDVSLLSLNPFANASSSQNVCVFSSTATKGYNVTATGSGANSAFTLSAGAFVPVLPYSVQWSQVSGQSSGATLSPGVALTG